MRHLNCTCRRFLATTVLTVIVVGYLMLGAYIFSIVRNGKGPEDESVGSLQKEIGKIKEESTIFIYDIVSHQKPENFNYEILKLSIADNIDELSTKLIELIKNQETPMKFLQNDRNTTLTETFFFSLSMLTTIGSGTSDLVLRSDLAKGILFPYVLIGIPLTLVWLLMLGTCFAHLIILIYNRLCCFCCSKRDSYVTNKVESDDDEETNGCCKTSESDNLIVPFIMILILLFIWMILGILGLINFDTNSWTYLDASLYIFTTLSTIGYSSKQPMFPEAINTKENGLLFFILYVVYICIGLVFVCSIVQLLLLIINKKFSQKKRDDTVQVTY